MSIREIAALLEETAQELTVAPLNCRGLYEVACADVVAMTHDDIAEKMLLNRAFQRPTKGAVDILYPLDITSFVVPFVILACFLALLPEYLDAIYGAPDCWRK